MATRKKKAPPEPLPPRPPDTPPEEEVIELLHWQGIEIEARYRPFYIGAPHLELHIASKKPIPVTDTGYRSRFDPNLPALIEAAGGLAEMVRLWLDYEACDPAWKETQAPKQLDLFG